MKILLISLGAILALLVAAFLVLSTPDTDPGAMKAKYGGPEARYAKSGRMRVHYRASGPEDRPVLVMIHGSLASLHTWEPLRARLEQDYRVIAYDQPGHGLTGPHPERDYSFTGLEEALTAVLDAEGVERATLIGSSFGGWLAWRDAIVNPGRVDRLVLISAAGLEVPQQQEGEGNLGFRILNTPVAREAIKRITPRFIIASSLKDTVEVKSIVDDAMVDRYWELLRYPGNRAAAIDQSLTELEDLSGRLGEIGVPTLILWGRQDALVPVGGADVFDARIPNSELVIYDGVGHLPMEEVPDKVAADIRDFLEANP